VSWADLMMALDQSGGERSFLAGEATFAIVKALHSRNLIVPTVGDFAGPKALRALAAYLQTHDATLSAFYVSNVESYLQRNGVWPAFCANVATMPLDESSVFIRPWSAGTYYRLVEGAQTPQAFTNPTSGALVQARVPAILQRLVGEPLMPIAGEVAANDCAGK
jgi:hypothetical protein